MNGNKNNKPTILIVHASVGSGHRSAACAVAKALELVAQDPQAAGAICPNGLNVEVHDILQFGRIVFDGDKAASMFTGATRPVYDITWRYTFTGRLLWGGGTVWAHAMYPKFVEYVRSVQPLAIVCTHITAANVAVSAKMITGGTFPIICIPTDYGAEGLWPHLHTNMFCVADEMMAESLRPRRVPEQNITITGIPASPEFQARTNKVTLRQKLGLPAVGTKRVILFQAGAKLQQPYVHLKKTIMDALPHFSGFTDSHFVIVTGQDKQFFNEINQTAQELGLQNITALGYVENMAELMSASDLVVCKPGGLTVTECLCAQVPMILTCRAYGQEKANVRTLTAAGAALHVTTARELVETLRRIEQNPRIANALLVNASSIRRPNAAVDIAKITLNQIAAPNNTQELSKKHFLHFYLGEKPAHPR
jgi:processive 1,2-diacylglycerol beta-glucosyltransferase